MHREDINYEEGLSISDMVRFLKENLHAFLSCIVLGIVGGLLLYSYLPNKWEADITIQVGKIPIMQSLNYIEEPADVVERIKSPSFLSKMVRLMYGKELPPESATARLLYEDLKVTVIKGSNLVKIGVFGWTPQEAYRNAGILGDAIVSDYSKVSASYLSVPRQQLKEVEEEITRNRQTSRQLDVIQKKPPSRESGDMLLRLAVIGAQTGEIQKLREEKVHLQNVISAAELQRTNIVGRSLVPRIPSSPKLGSTIIGGTFAGFLLGLAISIGLTYRRSRLP